MANLVAAAWGVAKWWPPGLTGLIGVARTVHKQKENSWWRRLFTTPEKGFYTTGGLPTKIFKRKVLKFQNVTSIFEKWNSLPKRRQN